MDQVVETSVFSSLLIILIALIILLTVAEWKILTKAGEKGWKSLIPFYNIFVSHHIVGMSHTWFIIEVITWIIEFVLELIKMPAPVVLAVGIAVGIFTLVSELVHIIKMCSCFGKGTWQQDCCCTTVTSR